MSDSRFKVGDKVKVKTPEGMIIRGEINFLDWSEARIQVGSHTQWWIRLGDIEFDDDDNQEETRLRHTCAPYVGPIHVENKCVYCTRYMTDSEVAGYVRKIGE